MGSNADFKAFNTTHRHNSGPSVFSSPSGIWRSIVSRLTEPSFNKRK